VPLGALVPTVVHIIASAYSTKRTEKKGPLVGSSYTSDLTEI
jgi:hypothetical protein